MKNLTVKALPLILFTALLLSSCSSLSTSMREPNMLVEFDKADFEMTAPVTAEAITKRILGIDFARLTKTQSGAVNPSASVFGMVPKSATASYALYNLMAANPGYDVIFYPQYETYKKGSIFFRTITVKTTAKLGKLAE